MKFNKGDIVIIHAGYSFDGSVGIVRRLPGENGHGTYGVECPSYRPSLFDGDEYWNCAESQIELIAVHKAIVITTDGRTTTARLKEGKQTVKSAKAVCNPSDTFNLNTGASLALNRLLYGTDYHPDEVAFKPTVREVKRPAKAGEWVKVVLTQQCNGTYKIGDIFKVQYCNDSSSVRCNDMVYLYPSEYVVLENYVPEKQEEPKYYSGKVVCVETHNLGLTVGKVYGITDGIICYDDGKHFTSVEHLNSSDWMIECKTKFIEYKGEQPAEE